MLQPIGRGAVTVIGLAMIVSFVLAACGSSASRSAAAVCHVWDTDALAVHNEYTSDASGELGFQSIVDLIAAPNNLAILMDKFVAVAPSEIEPDFEALATALHKESAGEGGSVTDPLGAIASGLADSLSVSGSINRINQYIDTNCQGSPGVPSSS